MKTAFLLVLASGVALAAPATPPAPLNPAPQQQTLQSVRKEIDALQKDIAQKQAVKEEAQSAIRQSQEALAETRSSLNQLEARHQTSAQQLAELRALIDSTRHKVALAQEKVGRMLARQYKTGEHDAMRLMLNARDPNQAGRDLTYYRHIARAQQQLIDDLAARRGELEQLSQALEAEIARLSTLSQLKSREKQSLEATQATYQQHISQLTSQISAKQNRLVTLKEAEKRLTALIAQINAAIEARRKEEARRVAEARKARQQAAQKENERRRKLAADARKAGKPVPKEAEKPVAVEPVEEVADSSAAGKAFRSLQGRMKLPVAGEIAGRFGAARNEGTTWKGLFIRTAPGQPVRAVADGQVVYADWLRGFGNAVIVDHGGNYMTVYTGLGNVARSAGQTVHAGDSLGSSGTLDSGESGLYFEIRHMGRPVNPLSWAR